jgi:hypothetical protein
MLLAGVLAGSFFVLPAGAQSSSAAPKPAVKATPVHYQPSRFSRRAALYYGQVWGVDSLSVKATEQGELIRFAYRVVDADRAQVLGDKKFEPELVDLQARVKLVVPQMEKVGKLRQNPTPEAGRSYWMAFSNKGRHVKRGDRVSVIIGQFRADGLVVE